jgi:uncharacterized protein (UPF0335 family)
MSEDRALYHQAVAEVLAQRKASTSYLQRRLRVGFDTASGLVDRMEREGLVSAPDHVGRREVLAPPLPSADAPGPSVSLVVPDASPSAWAAPVPDSGEDAETAEFEEVDASEDARDRLRSYVERIERLIEERKSISADIRDVYAEAKAVGFDPATIRKLISRRAMAPEARLEADALLEGYEAALGMVPGEEARPLVDRRPDAAALALALLTAEIVALEDEEQAAALVGHVVALLDIRAEIAELRREESDRRAQAKREGFDADQVKATVRWFEKVAKHGEPAMRAGEATFRLYRGTVERAVAGGPGRPSVDGGTLANAASPPPRRLSAREEASRKALLLGRLERASELEG